MASKDLHYNIQQAVAYNGASIAADGTTNGNTIDTQYFEALEFIAQIDAYTTGTATLNLQESDDGSVWTDVDPEFILGFESATVLNAANTSTRIGYSGKKRYARIQLVAASTAVYYFSGVAVLGHPHTAPTDTNVLAN